jgi:hypothetical protein
VEHVIRYPRFGLAKEGVIVIVAKWLDDPKPVETLVEVWMQIRGLLPPCHEWKLERDIFDLFLPEFDKPWVIHLRETCCCSTNLCTWRPNTVYKNRSVRRHQALFWCHCRGGKVKGTHILCLLSYLLVLLLVCECSKLFPLDSAIISFCFLFLF